MNNGSWDGSKWLCGDFGNLELAPIGTWADDYRPTKIRVTFSGGGEIILYVQDNSGPPNALFDDSTYTSEQEQACTSGWQGWSGSQYDITKMILNSFTGRNCTNIEFLE